MASPGMDIHYLRFVLHQDTDGILLSKKRPATVGKEIPQAEEMHDLLQLMVARGTCKVRLTGDDPGSRGDLLEVVALVSGFSGIGEVALTTSGLGLTGRVAELARAGLRSINFNLDTLRPERYRELTGGGDLATARSAMQESLACGLRTKVNCVLQKGVNLDELDNFVGLTKDQPIEARFIEWNASTDRVAPPEAFVSTVETLALIKPPMVHREPEPFGGPALRFEIPGHAGGVGFIANMTDHFCGDCARLAITDHGEIASCIFGRGMNLMRLLRSPGALDSVDAFVDRVVRRKTSLSARLSGWEAPTAPAAPPPLR